MNYSEHTPPNERQADAVNHEGCSGSGELE